MTNGKGRDERIRSQVSLAHMGRLIAKVLASKFWKCEYKRMQKILFLPLKSIIMIIIISNINIIIIVIIIIIIIMVYYIM